MPQQHLQRAQIRAVIQEMGGEAVAETVRTDLGRIDTSRGRVTFDLTPALLPGHRLAIVG